MNRVISGVNMVISGVNKVLNGVNRLVSGLNRVPSGVGVNMVLAGVKRLIACVKRIPTSVNRKTPHNKKRLSDAAQIAAVSQSRDLGARNAPFLIRYRSGSPETRLS